MTASAGPVLKKLYSQFGDQVVFVTLYVHEAHPGERYPQPQTFDQKLQYAREYKERDEIPWTVAVDSLQGDLHGALDIKPNSAYLMDTAGKVAFRTLWSNDPRPLRQGLEAVARGTPLAEREQQPRLVPMLRGWGKMYELLDFAGEQAKQDVLREAPPVYLLARTAALFRPLPPMGRSVAAMILLLVSGVLLFRLQGKLRNGSRKGGSDWR